MGTVAYLLGQGKPVEYGHHYIGHYQVGAVLPKGVLRQSMAKECYQCLIRNLW
jgi:hypothetical protein